MNREQLREQLVSLCVAPQAYSLSGLPNEQYVLSQEPNGQRGVCYSERGQKTGLRVFDSEFSACNFFPGENNARFGNQAQMRPLPLAKLLLYAMSARPINNAGDVYQFVGELKAEVARHGITELATQLESALRLGSSALEILGAVRKIIINNREHVDRLLGPDGVSSADQVIAFVDNSFGR